MDLLSTISDIIMGPDTSQMSEADRNKTEAARKDNSQRARAFAFDASNGNAGKPFMRPETSVGLGVSMEDLLKMIFGGGGGG